MLEPTREIKLAFAKAIMEFMELQSCIADISDADPIPDIAEKAEPRLVYVGHSGIPSEPQNSDDAYLFLNTPDHSGSEDVPESDVRDLPTGNVLPNFFLFGCGTSAIVNTPSPGEHPKGSIPITKHSLSVAFAKKFYTKVYGFVEHVTPGPIEKWRHMFTRSVPFDFGNFLGKQYFHADGDNIFPVVSR